MTAVGVVERAQAGDRAALGVIYDEYADRLFDFCFRLLRDRDAAADAVQDTFVLVAQRLSQLRDPARLRPWLYAIARHECFRWLAQRKREVVLDADVVIDDELDALVGAAESEAHAIALVQAAAAGLADRDRLVLELHERHGLDGDDLAAAVGIRRANPYSLVHRARAQLERAVGVLLVARMGRGQCAELDAALRDWDGALTPLLRKRIGRHVDHCAACTALKSRMNPLALLTAIPMLLAPKRADAAELGDVTQIAARLGLSEERWQPDGFPPPPDGEQRRRRRRLSMWIFGTGVLLAALVLLVAVAGGDDGGDGGDSSQRERPQTEAATTTPIAPTTSARVDATVAPLTTVAGLTASSPTTPTTRTPRTNATPAPATAAGPAPTVAAATTVPASTPTSDGAPSDPPPSTAPSATTPPTTLPQTTTTEETLPDP